MIGEPPPLMKKKLDKLFNSTLDSILGDSGSAKNPEFTLDTGPLEIDPEVINAAVYGAGKTPDYTPCYQSNQINEINFRTTEQICDSVLNKSSQTDSGSAREPAFQLSIKPLGQEVMPAIHEQTGIPSFEPLTDYPSIKIHNPMETLPSIRESINFSQPSNPTDQPLFSLNPPTPLPIQSVDNIVRKYNEPSFSDMQKIQYLMNEQNRAKINPITTPAINKPIEIPSFNTKQLINQLNHKQTEIPSPTPTINPMLNGDVLLKLPSRGNTHILREDVGPFNISYIHHSGGGGRTEISWNKEIRLYFKKIEKKKNILWDKWYTHER